MDIRLLDEQDRKEIEGINDISKKEIITNSNSNKDEIVTRLDTLEELIMRKGVSKGAHLKKFSDKNSTNLNVEMRGDMRILWLDIRFRESENAKLIIGDYDFDIPNRQRLPHIRIYDESFYLTGKYGDLSFPLYNNLDNWNSFLKNYENNDTKDSTEFHFIISDRIEVDYLKMTGKTYNTNYQTYIEMVYLQI